MTWNEIVGLQSSQLKFIGQTNIWVHDAYWSNLSVEALIFQGCTNIKIGPRVIVTNCGAMGSAAIWGTQNESVILEDVIVDLTACPLTSCSFVIMGSCHIVRARELQTYGNLNADGNGAAIDVGDTINAIIEDCSGSEVNQGAHLEKGSDLVVVANNNWRGCGITYAHSGGGIVLNVCTGTRNAAIGNNLSSFYEARGIYNYQSQPCVDLANTVS